MFLPTYASQVFIVIRGEHLAASISAYLITQIEQTPNAPHSAARSLRRPVARSCDSAARWAGTGEAAGAGRFHFLWRQAQHQMIYELAFCDAKDHLLTGRDLVADPRYTAS
ncbi:hypothetical protein [Hymenobacter volaticus]|uniref:Uncharacterized protein n=1 Tax=Hymenobacter volaticus TaxID=2932254 RepID=A0ABY4GCV6_9BACT|nr:hypothetical protein [Hymenobacter volaticus]UOQ68758.1 hypothetical protein MUN86_25070 [Hymenobacter volaticus]